MKQLWIFLFFTQMFYASDAIHLKGDIGTEYISYNHSENDVVMSGKSELTAKNESFALRTGVDFFYSQQYKDKRKIYLNELYGTYEKDAYKLQLGKILTYWGELEGNNLTDVFNPKNSMLDFFDKGEKRGAWSLFLTAFEENKNIELGIKFYEEDNAYVDKESPYNILPLSYKNTLQIHNRYDPTVHLKFSFSTDENIESESSIILQKGYDNKRYFAPINSGQIAQYAYKANKIMFLSNILFNDIIFKVEGAYTDVMNENRMSDYRQFGIGLEKGFYDFNGMDITLYTEYYAYDYLDDTKPKHVDVSELYDNDIFMALRFTLNDTRDSEFKIGFLKDLTCYESLTKAEVKSRVSDSLVLSAEALHFSKHFETYKPLANHTRFKLAVKYFF